MEKLWRILWLTAFLSIALGDQMLLVHVVWRHGSRSPMTKCPKDDIDEFVWPQGYDQLLPTGMQEHVNFGAQLYQRYSVQNKLVSGAYNETEVYVRSSDHDTTLQSAMSNFIGFYNADSANGLGKEYPDIPTWPKGYTPVPIHTVPFDTDYLLNQNVECTRQKWLWSEVMDTPEYAKLESSSKDLLARLSKACGLNVNLVNLWLYRDSFQIQLAQGVSIPVSIKTFDEMVSINNILDSYQTGVGLKEYNGINFKTEIGKIRGGSLLWDILNRSQKKIYCSHDPGEHCQSINRLKYYAYSASDKTVAALLATLGVEEKVFPNGGYPLYTAALAVELWNTTDGPAFKFWYHRNSTSNLTDITELFDGYKSGYCSFNTVRENGKKYYPGDITKLCNDVSSKRTSFDPDYPSDATTLSISSFIVVFAFLANMFCA